jgi:hypothetical protein
MLFAQALGLMHRQLHNPDAGFSTLGAQVFKQTLPTNSTSQTADDDASGLRHDASVCSLLDHLLLGSALLSNPLQVLLSDAAPVRLSQCVAPSPKSDPRLAFLARGPPQFIL